MKRFVILLLIFLTVVLLCVFLGEGKINSSDKKFERIDILSSEYYKDKIEKIKKIGNSEDKTKNKFIFAYYGSSGIKRRKLLKKLFDISVEDTDFINLGFRQKLDLWVGYDKKENATFVFDIDLLENIEVLNDDEKGVRKRDETLYNFDKLVEFILQTTNSIVIPLEKEDIKIEKVEKGEIKNQNLNTSNTISSTKEKNQIDFQNIFLPRKIEMFLEKINAKGKNILVYFLLMEQMKGDELFPYFLNYLQKKYSNVQFYLIEENQLNVQMLQKKNQNNYEYLMNNMKDLMKEIKIFKHFDSFNNKCVYTLYVIEESYVKCTNYFDKVYHIYEEQIGKGNVIENYGTLAKELLHNSLAIFNILTFEQTGTIIKKNILKKILFRFHNLIKKQILKQLMLLEDIYIHKAQKMILQNEFSKNEKILLNKDDEQLVNLKNSLIRNMKQQIENITGDIFQFDSFFEIAIEEFIEQFQEKLEQAIKSCCNLNQSPLKILSEKKKLKETIYKKRKSFIPSLHMNLTLTSLFRKSGYGNLQSYLICDLGPVTFVFGLLNDRDSPDVLQQTKEVPFFKFQPKLNVKVDWSRKS